jgi:hypothetical protein
MGAFRERITDPPGAILQVSPDPAHLHLFDGRSGQRLTKD